MSTSAIPTKSIRNKLFRLNNEQLKEWYQNGHLNMQGYFEAEIHSSDVPVTEKYPDFFFDKYNMIKLYYIPYLAENIDGANEQQLRLWANSMQEYMRFIVLDDFIILPWYPQANPITKEWLLKDNQIKKLLDIFTDNLFKIQKDLDLKLIPKDYTSIFLVGNHLKVLTLFDFEMDYKPRERIIFCDEELVSYNIDANITLEHESQLKLKEYLLEKGQRCIKF